MLKSDFTVGIEEEYFLVDAESFATAGVTEDAVVFHAGTKRSGDQVVTSGGRVLGVTALGDGLAAARRKAYAAADGIFFDQMQRRSRDR